jgi:hypothetical protein
MLQPVTLAQSSYFKDSFELKAILDELELPPNAILFTSDVMSTYTLTSKQTQHWRRA